MSEVVEQEVVEKEEVTEEEVVEEVVEPVDEPKKAVEPKTPTKYRVERAERQTEERILESLGYESLDDVQSQLSRLSELESQIAKLETERENEVKKKNLISHLEKENAFDPELLAELVDFNKVEDSDESYIKIVEDWKEKKPKHFGKVVLNGAQHVNTSTDVETDPIALANKRGDFKGSLSEYLKVLK